MEHKRQEARGTGARMVRFVPKESFHFVGKDTLLVPPQHIMRL